MFLLVRVLCLSLSCGFALSAAPTYEGNANVNCGGIYTGDNGTIESPWPRLSRNYQNRRRCVYEIMAPPGRTIALQFPFFYLHRRPWGFNNLPVPCSDWIRLFDGGNLLGGPFCGNEISPDRVFTSETSKIKVVFKSNRRRVFGGFRATYSFFKSQTLQPTDHGDGDDNLNMCGRPVVPRTPWTRPNTGNKIVGPEGNDVAPGSYSYPWEVGLSESGGNVFCGGALVDENLVLTAAHCTEELDRNDIWVVLGEHDVNNMSEWNETVKVQKTITHPTYSSINHDDDIALLKLESPVSLNDHVRPICLPKKGSVTPSGMIVTVTELGTTSVGGATAPVLLQADMPVVSNEKCKRVYREITSSMMCTGDEEGGTNACQGGSGGPVVAFPSEGPAYLIGLVGSRCVDVRVNTRVSAYVDWIQETMDKYT